MEYLSAKETAIKWDCSLREVQRLLLQGRVPDARKCGGAWILPADAEKPADPRKACKAGSAPTYLIYASACLPKNNPDAVLLALTPQQRILAAADLAYRRGDPEPAKACWRSTDEQDKAKLTTAMLAIAASVCSGDYTLYYEISRYLDRCKAAARSEEDRAIVSLPEALAIVSMAATEAAPDWLKRCDFSMFPSELSPVLLYLHALYLRNVGDKTGMLFTARTAYTLCAKAHTFTWLDLNFLLLCAGASADLGDMAMAEKYLSDALELGMPCGFLMPFADSLVNFGGLLERMIAQRYPKQSAKIYELWSLSFRNWIKFHNEFTRENITTILTPQEYQTARLVARGATYAEAAKHMHLSVSRIKSILSVVFDKLYIQKKTQLRDFVL